MKRWHMELIPQAKTIKKNNVIFTTPNSRLQEKFEISICLFPQTRARLQKNEISMCIIRISLFGLLDQKYIETTIWAKKGYKKCTIEEGYTVFILRLSSVTTNTPIVSIAMMLTYSLNLCLRYYSHHFRKCQPPLLRWYIFQRIILCQQTLVSGVYFCPFGALHARSI